MDKQLEQNLIDFDRFCEAVEARLKKGHEEYGGLSFSKPPAVTKREIIEELRDVAGWAFIMHRRMELMMVEGDSE